MRAALLVATFLLSACGNLKYSPPVDQDGDGFLSSDGDCNDQDNTLHPGAPEICDRRDNNCDGEADEALNNDWYVDADGDGHGDEADSSPVNTCSPGPGRSTVHDDCNDEKGSGEAVFPGAPELCDGVDNDCNGVVDEAQTWYPDADGDGFGDPDGTPVTGCQGAGWSTNQEDCDDTRSDVNPAAPEVCDGTTDEDCDGLVDEADPSLTDARAWHADADGDGYGDDEEPDPDVIYACQPPTDKNRTLQGGDCHDDDANYYPGAPESCANGRDYNCDGLTGSTDHDGDGFAACEECNDGDKAIYPGATEVCDGQDNDCSGQVDDNPVDTTTWYHDGDQDSFGDPEDPQIACSIPGDYVANADDCDDTNSVTYRGAPEICDHQDNDCNSLVDDASRDQMSPIYLDNDGDGYGSTSTGSYACFPTPGFADNGDDCNDSDATLNPETIWYPDLDSDGYGDLYSPVTQCEDPGGYLQVGGDCDDGDVSVTTSPIWYQDADGDFHGTLALPQSACTQPTGYVPSSDDCDDHDAGILGPLTWYLDQDGDSFGDAGTPLDACLQPALYVSDASDCDDDDGSSFPGGTEVCDNADNDCDGLVDNNATNATAWYLDLDGDHYGDVAYSVDNCTAPSGYVADPSDCDDTTSVSHPGASEVCDSADNDCDGITNESAVDATAWYTDNDGDGYGTGAATYACSAPAGSVALKSDCNDADASVSPVATELCDGIDNNCDGLTDQGDAADAVAYYKDLDKDTYGDPSTELRSCTNPGGGRVTNGLDCDDGNAATHPGLLDTWYDGIDTDCDGLDNPSVCDSLPPDSTIANDPTCVNPASGAWSVSIGWASSSIAWSVNPTYTHLGSAPVVAQLNDDDGDGAISERDTPDLAFIGATQASNGKTGCLRVVDGDSLTELSSTCTSGGYNVNATSAIAVADLDSDGTPELVVVGTGGNVLAFAPDGTRKWASTTVVNGNSASSPISIANLNSNSAPEILVGNYIYDSNGGWRTTLSTDCIYGFPADVDQDGDQEVVCGGAVYDTNGNALWTSKTGTGGYPGLADLDGDGKPEVVQSKSGTIYLFDAVAGTALANHTFSSASTSGVPILADYNGDGTVDIGVPLTADYQVLKYDASLKKFTSIWTAGGGLGALINGSTAADFDGDGAMDIVYGDKGNLHIWSVANNSTLYSTASYSGTAGGLVSPVVADYDGDGNAEILMAASSTTGNWDELKILEEGGDKWGNAPLTWNQFYTTGTNILDDMTIPVTPDAFWLGDNVFHAAVAPSGDPQGTPDLALDLLGACEDCVNQSIIFYLSAENLGSERAGGYVNIAVYTADASGVLTAVESANTHAAILPGDHLVPTAVLIDLGVIDVGGLVFSFDDDGTGVGHYDECDETNNLATWNEQVCN